MRELNDMRPEPRRRVVKPGRRDVAATIRARKAMDLYAQGLTYEEIAPIVGYSGRAACWTAIDRELARHPDHSADKLRRVQGARMTKAIKRTYEEAFDPKNPDWMAAMDRYLAATAQFSKLYGLNMDRDQALQTLPYIKHIVIEEPGTPLLQAGEVVEEAEE
jgi:hypothetical protein